MPTFVYLPESGVWINLGEVTSVGPDEKRPGVLALCFTNGNAREATEKDRERIIAALSKLTPKELT